MIEWDNNDTEHTEEEIQNELVKQVNSLKHYIDLYSEIFNKSTLTLDSITFFDKVSYMEGKYFPMVMAKLKEDSNYEVNYTFVGYSSNFRLTNKIYRYQVKKVGVH